LISGLYKKALPTLMIYTTNLTDAQCGSPPGQAIKILLPAKIWQRKRRHSIRTIVNAILYVVKGGIRKRLIIVDVLGLVLALRLTSANMGERAGLHCSSRCRGSGSRG